MQAINLMPPLPIRVLVQHQHKDQSSFRHLSALHSSVEPCALVPVQIMPCRAIEPPQAKLPHSFHLNPSILAAADKRTRQDPAAGEFAVMDSASTRCWVLFGDCGTTARPWIGYGSSIDIRGCNETGGSWMMVRRPPLGLLGYAKSLELKSWPICHDKTQKATLFDVVYKVQGTAVHGVQGTLALVRGTGYWSNWSTGELTTVQ
ncbi:hypothetical protein C8F04DRAFT_1190758 [Mycena alexandri]|uniref:Uncharacterized protein n=1 Tax=Mycena alexandri TaxID=1745969 RepID=A0AAD6SHH3_9AGAR|nr:hypothetical protein C8F04DRAFT_1190758 [Mycena alexandri]